MIRRRFLGILAGVCLLGSSISAETPAQTLDRVLRVDEVMSIMRDEGLRYGSDLDKDMLGGGGGTYFHEQVSRIYESSSMADTVRAALAETMTIADIEAAIEFFDTDLGQRILSLENAARVAMADPSVEAIARETFSDLDGSADARLAAVTRFVEINDLVERNVASGLNSNYHFFRGLAAGGGSKMGENDILADVWAQEPELREDTVSWLFGFLLMAYRPLSDDELEAYIVFSAAPGGQALNAGLFAGFDDMYRSISFDLGKAVARAMGGSDI